MKGRWIATLGVAILGAPVWLWYGHKALYHAACALDHPGTRILEPFKVEALTIENQGSEVTYWEPPWFLMECGSQCVRDLNTFPFGTNSGWSGVVRNGVPLEQGWYLRWGKVRKWARLWIAPAGSAECIAPLKPEPGEHGPARCIAAREITAPSTGFRAVSEPFRYLAYYEGGRTQRNPTSQQWRWFGLERHQHQLLRDGRVVARYVWYVSSPFSDLLSVPIETCPVHAESWLPGKGLRAFWDRVLDPKGVKPQD